MSVSYTILFSRYDIVFCEIDIIQIFYGKQAHKNRVTQIAPTRQEKPNSVADLAQHIWIHIYIRNIIPAPRVFQQYSDGLK